MDSARRRFIRLIAPTRQFAIDQGKKKKVELYAKAEYTKKKRKRNPSGAAKHLSIVVTQFIV